MTTRKRKSVPGTTADGGSTAAERPRSLLVTIDGGVQIHPLPESGALMIGRGHDSQLVLDHRSISRQHARLELGSVCVITDMGSRNGTFVRGERLVPQKPRALALGESFTLGKLSLLLLAPGAAPLVAAVAKSQLRVEDPTSQDVSGILTAIARSPASVLILGETGVGKEVLAARIHQLSERKGPFIAINCAALSETLLESELFGHEKGAFTGATETKEGLLRTTAGGTLLLDEIGEMSPSVQAKMLRAIETQTILRRGGVRPLAIDVRFLAATHRDLVAASEQNAFRRDLYFRLAGFSLYIPPLRSRRGQIMRLATEILAAQTGMPPSIMPAAALALTTHEWPGNVRELRNVIVRALVLSGGGDIHAEHILFDAVASPPAAPVEDDDRARLVAALEACAGNQTRAAALLGISRTTFVQKMRLYGIPRPRIRR